MSNHDEGYHTMSEHKYHHEECQTMMLDNTIPCRSINTMMRYAKP